MIPNEAVLNIQKLAASGFDPATMNPTRRADAALAQISAINHQEVHDRVIAQYLCDIHHCLPVRLQAIERRAYELLRQALVLINLKTGEPLRAGDRVTTFRGETGILTGHAAPRHTGSTGRVYVRFDGQDRDCEFFPAVIDATFQEAR